MESRERTPTSAELQNCIAKTPGPWCKDPFVEDHPSLAASQLAFAVAISPPVLIFLVGLGISYLIRGQSPKKDS
jgi:hypothetical protein